MIKSNTQFRIVKLAEYDVLVPFLCHKCGACCRSFAPQIYKEDVPRIAQYLGKPKKDIEKEHDECYKKKFTDTPEDCLFLTDKNLCAIYPLRPKCCRLYPLSTTFGVADDPCPGHAEFYRIVDSLFRGRRYAAMWDPRHYHDKIRAIPNRSWSSSVWRRLLRAKPSQSMVQKFATINGRPPRSAAPKYSHISPLLTK